MNNFKPFLMKPEFKDGKQKWNIKNDDNFWIDKDVFFEDKNKELFCEICESSDISKLSYLSFVFLCNKCFLKKIKEKSNEYIRNLFSWGNSEK